ncbi:MAG: MEDS domain-containing protein [Thermoanaerobacterales bacterium]|nr:MEDS domain-containing protein [Bacillota bacterium]MDI6907984.1 MEDS domain-containing protein [Thermoanaerobacterales bacterium]
MKPADTSADLRKTGINYINDVPWGTHIAGFFGTKHDLVNLVVPYLRTGLENNEFCLWVTSDPIGTYEAVKALDSAIPGFASYHNRGRIEVISHSEWYLKYGDFDNKTVLDSWIGKVEGALSQGYDGIRVCGNTTWLKKRYWKKFMEYEAEVHKRIGGLNMIALCIYQLDKCSIHELVDVVSNHHFSFITADCNLEHSDIISNFDRLDLIARMAAGIAHEIRNPMTSIKGFLQLLQEKEDLQRYNNYFSLVIEEVERANSIIREFLSLARDKNTFLRQENINTILLRLLPLLQADALKENKRIALDLGEVPEVLLNSKDMRQVILNLSRNGLDAMPPGGTLTVRTYANDHEAVLEVQDEGTGISPDNLERIGTPFFSTKEQGTGLGLATCYRIMEKHNAIMDFRTGPTGTTFYIRFKPFRESSSLSPAEPAAPRKGRPALNAQGVLAAAGGEDSEHEVVQPRTASG